MKKLLLILCCFPLLMAATCEDEDDNLVAVDNCSDEVIPALNVVVKDANTGQVVSDGVTITAQDGSFSEILDLVADSNPATFEGAFERPGIYVITVQKSGYQTFVSNGFDVTANPCHVNTRSLTLEITPF